jgi:ribose transport system ATP-binding protein
MAVTPPNNGEEAMADKRLLLKLSQIDKSFPGVHALDHVDFDLYEGEVHVLLGENGAGKSTLVKIISGSLEPDSGKIFIRQDELDRLDPERSQERGIGMVYQELSSDSGRAPN